LTETIKRSNTYTNKINRKLLLSVRTTIFYNQTDGLSMGAPTSAKLAETYNQQIEHKEIYSILIKHQITGYCRYVKDILIIYDQRNKYR
jgi:hypothetical protein